MKTRHLVAIATTFAITAFATVLGLNITAGEKEINRHLEHHYDVADPQFLRSMSVLLGPALVDGNRTDTLLNGDQIFPAMLDAIRHRTVDEIWFVLSGFGEIWRKQGGREEIVTLEPGVSLTIPVGTHFQFRATGEKALEAVGVTMPPWPGDSEVVPVPGKWNASEIS